MEQPIGADPINPYDHPDSSKPETEGNCLYWAHDNESKNCFLIWAKNSLDSDRRARDIMNYKNANKLSWKEIGSKDFRQVHSTK